MIVLFHKHNFKRIKAKIIEIKIVPVIADVYMETLAKKRDGIKVLEQCECGKYRAYLMDENQNRQYKTPEILFPELVKDA